MLVRPFELVSGPEGLDVSLTPLPQNCPYKVLTSGRLVLGFARRTVRLVEEKTRPHTPARRLET